MRDQFMQAVRHLQAGELDAAGRAIDALLASAPSHPEVLHLAGVIRFEQGAPEAGERLLAQATAGAPRNPEIPYNHASALLKLGELERAAERFQACLAIHPGHASARNNLGTVLKRLNRIEEAVEQFQHAIATDPNHAGARVNLGQLQLQRGDAAAAREAFERATRLNASLPGAWLGLGEALLDLGQPRSAEAAITRAIDLDGSSVAGWQALARARTELIDFEGALEAARRVTELAPESADAWNNLSSAWTSLGRLGPAEDALERALALDPDHLEARVNRAALMELSNRTDEALAVATADAEEPRLRLVRARCLLREQAFDEARALLEGIASENDPWLAKDAWFTLGQLEDRARRPEAAWMAFVEGNRRAGELWFRNHPEPDRFVPGLAGLARHAARPEAWTPASGGDAGVTPAFLFGFQRSGTTLIDTVLGVHERVRVMEEQPAINRVIARMVDRHGAYPDSLGTLSEDALADLRACYRENAGRLLGEPVDDVLLLDKSPLHTVHLPLIRRLFPGAPLVLALRHPLDLCLSCFMQDFTMSAFMTNFLSVEGVARVYRAVFDTWFACEPFVGDAVHVIRYENLVEAPEAELRALVAHLGLAWDDRLLDHTGAARDRGLINTPSYEQVTRPIYRTARHRWERYSEYLEGIRAELADYLERLGYEAG